MWADSSIPWNPFSPLPPSLCQFVCVCIYIYIKLPTGYASLENPDESGKKTGPQMALLVIERALVLRFRWEANERLTADAWQELIF